MSIPSIYRPAVWRNTTPRDGGRIGIGFDSDGGTTRISISEADAAHLVATLAAQLGLDHPDRTAGIPSAAV